jgi:hypothetical protein
MLSAQDMFTQRAATEGSESGERLESQMLREGRRSNAHEGVTSTVYG